jgi:hypothetical protein
MAAHTSSENVVYQGLGHDVGGPEVTDFVMFIARQLRHEDALAKGDRNALAADQSTTPRRRQAPTKINKGLPNDHRERPE